LTTTRYKITVTIDLVEDDLSLFSHIDCIDAAVDAFIDASFGDFVSAEFEEVVS